MARPERAAFGLSSASSSADDTTIPQGLQKTSLGYIVNPTGIRPHYYMSIMKEAHSKMCNNGKSDVSFKKGFTAQRSRQFDILQAKEAPFLSADGCSERVSEFTKPGYQLKPSDGRKVNLSIKEHIGKVEKLNVKLRDVKEHDSTLFQSSGLPFKQGEEFAHTFNVKQIKCVEAKLTKVTQDMEALEIRRGYDSIFKGILKEHINKRRRKKENRRKSDERKRKQTENNVQRVYGSCVGNPLGNDLPQYLMYIPSLAGCPGRVY